MRLFIAFDVSSSSLRSLQQVFEGRGVRLTNHLHCTLLFLGDVPDVDVPAIREKLAALSFSSFSFRLHRLQVFPNSSYVRIVHVELAPKEPLVALHHHLLEILPEYKEDRSFVPHVTLARVAFLPDKAALLRKLNTPLPSEEFLVDHLTLYRSVLDRDGPTYHVVDVFDAS